MLEGILSTYLINMNCAQYFWSCLAQTKPLNIKILLRKTERITKTETYHYCLILPNSPCKKDRFAVTKMKFFFFLLCVCEKMPWHFYFYF